MYCLILSRRGYEKYKYDAELDGLFQREGRMHISAGMGLDYFITPDIAIETEIGTVVFDTKNAVDQQDLFYARIGCKSFLNRSYKKGVT